MGAEYLVFLQPTHTPFRFSKARIGQTEVAIFGYNQYLTSDWSWLASIYRSSIYRCGPPLDKRKCVCVDVDGVHPIFSTAHISKCLSKLTSALGFLIIIDTKVLNTSIAGVYHF